MMSELLLDKARGEIHNINLTEDYKGVNIKKKFKSHLEGIISTANHYSEVDIEILKSKTMRFTKRLYWELENFIFEQKTNLLNEKIIDDLDEIEDELRSTIETNLGTYFDRQHDGLNDLIENSTNSFKMAFMFDFIQNDKKVSNPWLLAKEILTTNNLLHTFSNDMNYVKNVIGLKINDNDSEEIKGNKLVLVGKGRKTSFSKNLVRDLFGLRRHVLNLIRENAPDSARPINSVQLIGILRKQGVEEIELSDSQIKNWLIRPLKSIGKIGSSKSGYFELKTCMDLEVTYYNHFENFKGYMQSLEKYRSISLINGCDQNVFEKHLREMKNLLASIDDVSYD